MAAPHCVNTLKTVINDTLNTARGTHSEHVRWLIPMRPLFNIPAGGPGVRDSLECAVRTLEARVLLDRPLDLDRDPPLHRQRELLTSQVLYSLSLFSTGL